MNMTEEMKFRSNLTVADMVAVFLCLREPNARACGSHDYTRTKLIEYVISTTRKILLI